MLHISVEYNLHRKPSGSPSVIKLYSSAGDLHVIQGRALLAVLYEEDCWIRGGPFPTPCPLLTPDLILESTVKRLFHTVFPRTPWVWPSMEFRVAEKATTIMELYQEATQLRGQL